MSSHEPSQDPEVKVLLLGALPPPAGGVATWTQDLLESARGSRTQIVPINRSAGQLNRGAARNTARRLWVSAQGATRAVRELRSGDIELVHICVTGSPMGLLRDLPVIRLARRLGIPIVIHIHGSATRVPAGGWIGALTLRILRSAARVIVLNEPSRDHLTRLGLEQVCVLPNGVPLLDPGDLPRSSSADPLIVIFVGWLKPAKGVLDLIRAVSEIDGITLRLVGRFVDEAGVQSEELIRAALADPAIAQRVELIGEVPRQACMDHLREAHIFALPSHSEGLPMALLEAMMVGVAPIVSAVGGMPEAVVDSQTGRVVPARDHEALVAALRAYVEDRDLVRAHGRASRERALDRYAAPRLWQELEQLWHGLVQR